jgi:hypothetical protein
MKANWYTLFIDYTWLSLFFIQQVWHNANDGPCFGVLGYLLYIMSRYLQRSIKDSKTQTLLPNIFTRSPLLMA